MTNININDIFDQDNATMLIDTDPLTGERVETELEWTAAHERELLAMAEVNRCEALTTQHLN